MIKIITDVLLNDTTLIEHLLEEMEMFNPHQEGGEIRCGMPDSQSNNRSVRILLNEYLGVSMYSDEADDFNSFEIQNLFTLIQYIKGIDFFRALKWICGTLGIEFQGKTQQYEKSNALTNMKRFKPKKNNTTEHKILDSKYLDQYKRCIIDEWINEGIDAKTQHTFGICDDPKYSRWKFPIYDENWNLITLKGRTYVKNFQFKDIAKYVYYPSIGNNNNILFGLNLTLPFIESEDELILLEGEKSVMKLWGWGIKNSTSISSSIINPNFVNKIISLNCRNVVICLDKGIDLQKVKAQAEKLKFFKNVYYIYDYDNLLDNKDAPVDKGLEVWMILYNNKVRI